MKLSDKDLNALATDLIGDANSLTTSVLIKHTKKTQMRRGDRKMPMSFPDMRSLLIAAEVHNFRQPSDGESEQEYRAALADHVTTIDCIEGHEICTGKSWDEWSEEDYEDSCA